MPFRGGRLSVGAASAAKVAIVDFGLGNLFSVKRACEHAGLLATITRDRREILAGDAVILPGVGAFGDAMATLHRLDLVSLLRDVAVSPNPLVGICLGVQLLFTESQEFGHHRGLDIVSGDVVRLEGVHENGRLLKVPHVGWNGIEFAAADGGRWQGSLLEGISPGERMYFVHSYVVRPQEPELALSQTIYGGVPFCSSLSRGSLFACQFHPERSGPTGLKIYENLARRLRDSASRPEGASA